MAAFISASLCLVSCVLATPGSHATNQLTILTHNDLYGESSHRQASTIVVSKPQSYSASVSSCARLGENLWSFERSSEFLRYLDYDSQRQGQDLYWVASTAGAECNAITAQGRSQQLPCETLLPALCNNSAPLSSIQSNDNGQQWQTSVSTGNATILGYRDRHSFRFLGIKYASIPSRFSHSTYLSPVGTNISALSYGPRCFQRGCDSGTALCSEDCLYLNIWTPTISNAKGTSKKKAVMLWIHGGGLVGGYGSDTTFDGGAIASRGDVVLVTLNYRLGNFGFLALDGTPLTGNYGLRDQKTALDWLHAHIDAFGGDKDRITVFGQSAGAASVRALLASPQARGKFIGAITQSTPQGLNDPGTFSKYMTIAEATNRTKSLLNETSCTSSNGETVLACLQAVPATKLTSGTVAFYPVLDNSYLTSSLLLGPTAPKQNVTLLTGTMWDDGSPFTSYPTTLNRSAVLLSQDFPASTLDTSLFPLPPSANQTLALFNLSSQIATQAYFTCLDHSTALAAAKHRIFTSTFSYQFARAYQLLSWSPNPPACEPPRTAAHPNGDTSLPYHRCHSGELYYVFGTLLREGGTPRDESDVPFSQFVLDSWTAFARRQVPVPETEFLDARGFVNTTLLLRRAGGTWGAASGAGRRVLDVRSEDVEWPADWEAQCEALGLGGAYWDM